MRKDVKLGMAIGGGLIVLLVGYLLLAPPSNNTKKGAQFAGGAGAGSIIDPATTGELSGGGDEKPAKPVVEGTVPAAPVGNEVHPSPSPTAPKAGEGGAKSDAKPDAKPTGDQWGPTLDKGKTPGEVTKAPAKEKDQPRHKTHEETEGSAAPKSASPPKLLYNPGDAWGGGVSTDAVFGSPSAHSGKADLAATNAKGEEHEVAGGGGTHIVKAGETLSSIALAAYGSSAYYPHILRANPNINPNNLKLGTPLKMPHINEVKAEGTGEHAPAAGHSSGESAANDVKIDPSKQYKVQAGDSLYKISMKIYGKSSYVDKLYEKNKALIGADNKRLKLGMILDLPEKGSTASAAPREETDSSLSEAGGGSEENQAK
jgi:nucleoid-associated protein YgaU